MSFASNNSRNVANLLRYEPLEPISQLQVKRNLPLINPNAPNSRERDRAEIPVEQAFTPQEPQKRMARRKTPKTMNQEYLRGTNKNDDLQLQSFKVRLDQIVRYYDERHNNLESKMMVRLNQLENFVMKEVPKIDNNTMIASDIIGFKEAIKEVRRQQQYQNNQINALKMMASQKNNQEIIANQNKEKERSTTLFFEMVRLGETVEKIQDSLKGTSRGSELRYQDLQNRLMNTEKMIAMIGQKTATGNDQFNDLGQKIMNRLQSAETNLLILGKEHVKDQEGIARLMAQNDRLGQDLQLLLRNMQTDFQSKLENRIQETVNRLMIEHEERIRSHEEIKKNLDLRERIAHEKLMSEKMETKAKYDTMDAVIKNQLLRKEESIRALHKAMQDQFRNIMGQLQVEGSKRKDQEMSFRGEIKRVQESFRKEYDLYKNHQSELVQKFTDMIKTEIEVRLSTQLDLKKLTSDTVSQIVTELNNIKEATFNSNKKLNFSIREVANESAERAGQLSHYIDAEIKKVVEVVTEKYSKMKNVFTKLAEQLRNHLLNTQDNRKKVETRLSAIEDNFQSLKNQVNTQIDEFYTDLEARLKEEKEFVETVVFKKNNDLTLRVSKLEEYTNQYFELLKAGIEDNKELLSKKISGLNEGKGTQNEQEMKELRSLIFNIKNLTESIKEESEGEFRELKSGLRDLDNRSKDGLLDLEDKINQKIVKTNTVVKELDDQLNELSVKINNLRADSNKPETSISNDKLKKISDEIDQLANRTDANQKFIDKVAGQITVLRAQINTLETKIEKVSA